MPRYFFDFSEGELTSRDEEGLDLPDLACAKNAAVATLPDLVRESDRGAGEAWTIRSRVRDEMGQTVYQATLSYRAEDAAG